MLPEESEARWIRDLVLWQTIKTFQILRVVHRQTDGNSFPAVSITTPRGRGLARYKCGTHSFRRLARMSVRSTQLKHA